jgi:membrane associated rhomboid family serine protease
MDVTAMAREAIRREPGFHAPLEGLALAGALLLAAVAQFLSGDVVGLYVRFGLDPVAVGQGRIGGLFTYMFVHQTVFHAASMVLMSLVVGPPVARLFEAGWRRWLGTFSFFIICGVIAGAGFCAAHAHQNTLLIGSSGAVAGLFGGAARSLVRGRAGLGPILSPLALFLAAAWGVINLIAAGVSLGGGGQFNDYGWEAHAAGFVAGLLLIGPLKRVLSLHLDARAGPAAP